MSNGKNFSESATSYIPTWIAGIIVALPEELATLSSCKITQGECIALNDNILLVYAGAGPVNAEQATQLLIGKGVNCLISWGCAAALSKQLKPGDLIVPERVLSEANIVYQTDKIWLQHFQSLLAGKRVLSTGTLTESSRIVALNSDKVYIRQKTGADALDMESAAVFRSGQRAGLPCLAVRAIADPVNMDLPQAVVNSLNSQGRIELTKLLQFLLTHPWEIPALIKLGLHFNAAGKSLKIVANQIGEIINFKKSPPLTNSAK